MVLNLRKRKKDDGRQLPDLQTILGNAAIPTFPLPVIKSLEALRQPNSRAADVAEALEMDPGLTVRLLKLVNSAAFSPAKPVESVDRAVAVAGFSTVESLVLSVGVNKVLPAAPVDGYDHVGFWRVASRRATTARAFAAELHPATASVSFTAGLLQDMAVPLLAGARQDYAPLLVEWHGGGADLHELEQQAFGWAHDDVAGMLCREWGLPDALAVAIATHHDEGGDAPPGVQLAAPLREEPSEEIMEHVVARATTEFGLAADRVVTIIADAEAQAGEVAGLFT